MLVLTRKKQQSIVIEDDGAGKCMLKVTVLEIHGGRVELGLEVPAGARIRRNEASQQAVTHGQPRDSRAHSGTPIRGTDRWDDDGGGVVVAAGVHATPDAAVHLVTGDP